MVGLSSYTTHLQRANIIGARRLTQCLRNLLLTKMNMRSGGQQRLDRVAMPASDRALQRAHAPSITRVHAQARLHQVLHGGRVTLVRRYVEGRAIDVVGSYQVGALSNLMFWHTAKTKLTACLRASRRPMFPNDAARHASGG